ncbi:MAG TPA: HAD-IIA family hydrolase, partial [Candidatus Nanopelagicales bacterium]|nr:HAD-IIA family hydrolase [Candidatus Nanopelagicales bacterium]
MSEGRGSPTGGTYDWFVRGRELLEAGDAAAAAELLSHAVEQEPTARSVRETLARALFDARRYDDAAVHFQLLIDQAPDDHYAHFGAGLSLWRRNQLRQAAEHLSIAVAMRPGRGDYQQALREVRATLAARAAAGMAVAHPPRAADRPDAPPEQVLCRAHDVALLDLDGVVYRGADAVPWAVTSVRAAAAQGMRAAYVTNNAARPPAAVAAQLRELGLVAATEDVVTSAQAGARLVVARTGPGARVMAVGGPGVAEALAAHELVPVSAADHDGRGEVAAVLMGFGREVSWRDLAAASWAIERGAFFVATNTDLTVPTADGIAPGNGSLVQAVVNATGQQPEVAGKPFPPLLQSSIERTAAANPLVVGDRLDTDIEGAASIGAASLLVLTGVTGVGELLAATPAQRPT